MPTINKSFLLKLLLVLAVSCGGLFGVHALQARRIPDALKRQADRAAENGKTDNAIHYLRQYLEFRPHDVEARCQLAELVHERRPGDTTELMFLYDQILRSDPTRHVIRREALTVCLRMGRFTDAEAHTEELLKAFPNESDLWQKQAAAQAQLHKLDEARQSYESAIRTAPHEPLPYQRFAQFLWRDAQRPDEARGVLDRLIVAMPYHPEAYLTRARYDAFTSDSANTIPDLKTALEVDPENAEALLMLAEQLQKRRELAAARDCLADGVRLYPEDARLVRSLAWLELNRGSIGAAVAVLEDGLDRIPGGGFDLLVPLADLLVQLGETQRSEEIVRKLEARSDKTARMQVKYLKARLAMRQEQWATATQLLNDLRTDAVGLPGLDAQANLLLAMCYQRQADTTAEQDTLKLVLNKDPNHLAARIALGQAYLNAGRFTEAEAEYDQAVRSQYAAATTHSTLVRLKAARLRTTPKTTPREWDALEKVTGELARVFGPASVDPILLSAEVVSARGEPARAVTMLRAEAARRPSDTRLWAALASATANVAGVAVGLGILDEAQAAAGDGPEVRVARADLYARDPSRIRPIAPLADQIDTWPDADQLRLLYGLLEVYDRLGDDAGVVKMSKRIAARRPGDLVVWEALCERAHRLGDTKSANEAREAIARLDTTGKTSALADAWATLAAKDVRAAATAADAVAKAFGEAPNRAEACVTLGRLRALAGDALAADKMLDRASRLEPTRFGPAQEQLVFLASQPSPQGMTALLTRLGRDPRWNSEPFRRVVRAAALRLPTPTAKQVLDTARSMIEPQPGGLGWLGDVYLAIGQPEIASECFQQAAAKKLASPDDWLRLAVRTSEAGSTANAEQTLAGARKAMPLGVFFGIAATFVDVPTAPSGWSPELTNAVEKRAFTQARLALKLSRYQRDDATALLVSFLKTKNLSATDAAWGRRNLAMLLVSKGAKADRERAMTLLVEDGGPIGETPDEKRATAAVLAALSRYLDGAERQTVLDRAAKILEGVAQETKAPRDGFLLAQVYRAIGNRKASTEVMNQLLAADPKNLDFHLFALEDLTEMTPLPVAHAEQFAERLLAEHPTDFRVVAAVSRFECKAGRPDRALALAEGYTRTADASAGDLPSKQARAAELLDELARLSNVRRTDIGRKMVRVSVELYEGLVSSRPEAVIAAAGLVAADGRTADAFAVIDRYTRGQTNRLKASAGLAVLRAGGANDGQRDQVLKWLELALAQEPASLSLKLNEGEFYALKQEYSAAERAYEAVLKADPRNVVALNNLAWILAPRPDRVADAITLIDRAVAEVGLTGELLDTRARVRIAAKQFEMAERDLHQALTQQKTPLRMFHLALAKQSQTPPRPGEAQTAFRQARDRGLEESTVHPADVPQYRAMESEFRSGLKVD